MMTIRMRMVWKWYRHFIVLNYIIRVTVQRNSPTSVNLADQSPDDRKLLVESSSIFGGPAEVDTPPPPPSPHPPYPAAINISVAANSNLRRGGFITLCVAGWPAPPPPRHPVSARISRPNDPNGQEEEGSILNGVPSVPVPERKWWFVFRIFVESMNGFLTLLMLRGGCES